MTQTCGFIYCTHTYWSARDARSDFSICRLTKWGHKYMNNIPRTVRRVTSRAFDRFIWVKRSSYHIYIGYRNLKGPHWQPAVVGKVHRSSTWVKVQIRIIKYYSIKSKSTAFSILLEWKYKSTQFFMYLSKKVLIDRFILQFYIDYFISFYISTYFYNHTAQNTWVFPKITTI